MLQMIAFLLFLC